METAIREYRVWCVNGELAGCAEVFKRRAWYTVELSPFYTADSVKPKGFRSKEAAYRYASECADEYLTQAREEERTMHEQEGCCVPSDEDMCEWQDSYWVKVVDNEEGREMQDWEL